MADSDFDVPLEVVVKNDGLSGRPQIRGSMPNNLGWEMKMTKHYVPSALILVQPSQLFSFSWCKDWPLVLLSLALLCSLS